jgi:hypothetical protein
MGTSAVSQGASPRHSARAIPNLRQQSPPRFLDSLPICVSCLAGIGGARRSSPEWMWRRVGEEQRGMEVAAAGKTHSITNYIIVY